MIGPVLGAVPLRLDMWDYITFAALLILLAAVVIVLLLIAGLPGRIAIARKHPDAEAVKLMGWAGFLPVVPWIQAFIWAFKPTNVVDIRNFPREEQREIAETIARLRGKPAPPSANEPQHTEPGANQGTQS